MFPSDRNLLCTMCQTLPLLLQGTDFELVQDSRSGQTHMSQNWSQGDYHKDKLGNFLQLGLVSVDHRTQPLPLILSGYIVFGIAGAQVVSLHIHWNSITREHIVEVRFDGSMYMMGWHNKNVDLPNLRVIQGDPQGVPIQRVRFVESPVTFATFVYSILALCLPGEVFESKEGVVSTWINSTERIPILSIDATISRPEKDRLCGRML